MWTEYAGFAQVVHRVIHRNICDIKLFLAGLSTVSTGPTKTIMYLYFLLGYIRDFSFVGYNQSKG